VPVHNNYYPDPVNQINTPISASRLVVEGPTARSPSGRRPFSLPISRPAISRPHNGESTDRHRRVSLCDRRGDCSFAQHPAVWPHVLSHAVRRLAPTDGFGLAVFSRHHRHHRAERNSKLCLHLQRARRLGKPRLLIRRPPSLKLAHYPKVRKALEELSTRGGVRGMPLVRVWRRW